MRSIYLGRRKGGSTVGSLLSEIYSSRCVEQGGLYHSFGREKVACLHG